MNSSIDLIAGKERWRLPSLSLGSSLHGTPDACKEGFPWGVIHAMPYATFLDPQ